MSIFGAMFAPKPFDVAKETVRGHAGRTDCNGELDPGRSDTRGADPEDQLRLLAAASRRFREPDDLGVEENVIERFVAAGVPEGQISFGRATYTFSYPSAPSDLLAQFRTYYGPTMNAFEAATGAGREAELQAELEALFNAQNASSRKDLTAIPATFLLVTVSK